MFNQPVHQMPIEEVLIAVDSPREGLSTQEAAQRQASHGPNELISAGKKSLPRIFLEQFADFLVFVLIIAAALSAMLGNMESAVVILAVITMNAVLGTVQTVKAASSLEGLKRMSAPTARVLRDGEARLIPGCEVTVGDVVELEAGDFVCADGRLLEHASLRVDESALTGESLPVEKELGTMPKETVLGDRRNMVFSGSFVTYGRGKFLVTGIGMGTEMGKIAALMHSAGERKTPLQVSLDQFGRKLSFLILGICAVLFAVSVLVRGEPAMNAFLFAVALAVAAIPEALSSIVTVVLSFGTRKMAKENAVIRRLQAVEGLGSVSVICSDKTGTLTQNRMTVQKLWTGGQIVAADAEVDDPAKKDLLQAALLCSDAQIRDGVALGDPTEIALVRLGGERGLSVCQVRRDSPRLAELPFDSDRKLMSTANRVGEEIVLFTKGAVDVLLDRTNLTQSEREAIFAVNDSLSQEGLRVLAFGRKSVPCAEIVLSDEANLTFLGLIAMIDPPREESLQAVRQCVAAGIRPVMITGDHKITACAIARQIGILTGKTEAINGCELDHISDEELRRMVPRISVYARVSPEHKIRIVRAWQDRGELVAMTGDGVNDAPALRQADIGVAMGRSGTEVAKDAAGMVLTDDNFATIVQAVKNGRNVYANIKRAIRFLLSGNTAGVLTVLYASLAALPVPFAAVHLLFINLLTDSLPAIALGLEPHNQDVMMERPRPRGEGILTRAFLSGVAVEGLVIALATIFAFHIGLQAGPETGSTMAFATLCLSRLLHGFCCKSDRPVLFTRRMFNNRYLLAAFALGIALLGAVLTVKPLSQLLEVAPLSLEQLGWIMGLSAAGMLVNQLIRSVRKVALPQTAKVVTETE